MGVEFGNVFNSQFSGDSAFLATTFVVIDFETTTPKGYRPEPIEVAALAIRIENGNFLEIVRFSSLMRPPDHAPLSMFDTEQTGITSKMLFDQPDAPIVLSQLESCLNDPTSLLVAHNAPTEAGILCDYKQYCPKLAAIDFIDTVRLAKRLLPQLNSHRLDALIDHFNLTRPKDRHRSMADVEVTARLFIRLLEIGMSDGRWSTLGRLISDGGYSAKGAPSKQSSLF